MNITYESAIAITLYKNGFENKVLDYKNLAYSDKNNHFPSDWTKAYVNYANKENLLPDIPISYSANANKLWLVKFILSIKGISQWNYDKQVEFSDINNLSTDEKMLLSAAVRKGLISYKNDKFNPDSNIIRSEFFRWLKNSKNLLTPETKTDYLNQNNRIMQQYYISNSRDMDKFKLSKNSDLVDCVIFELLYFKEGTTDIYDIYDKSINTYNLLKSGHSGSDVNESDFNEMITTLEDKNIKKYIGLQNYVVDQNPRNTNLKYGFSEELAKKYLYDFDLRTKLIGEIIKFIDDYNLDGINLDFSWTTSNKDQESNYTKSDRNIYTIFLKELSSKLKNNNKDLSIALPAAINDTEEKTRLCDYEEISEIADYVNILLYDDNTAASYQSTGKTGPISNALRIERALKYSSFIFDKSKIIMGLGLHTFDYNLSNKNMNATKDNLLTSEIYTYQNKKNFKHNWNSETKTPYITYTDENNQNHEIHYEDSNSLKVKFNLVKRFDIAGISIWYYGAEIDEFWNLYENELKTIENTADFKLTDPIKFDDLSNSHWAYNSINKLSERGIMKGYPDNKFGISDTLNRAQLAISLSRALGLKSNQPTINFSDVNQDWMKNEVAATSKFFPLKNDGKFEPFKLVSREEFCFVIAKIMNYSNTELGSLERFSDNNDILSDYKIYVSQGINNHLISGFTDGELKPKRILTRSEFALILDRMSLI